MSKINELERGKGDSFNLIGVAAALIFAAIGAISTAAISSADLGDGLSTFTICAFLPTIVLIFALSTPMYVRTVALDLGLIVVFGCMSVQMGMIEDESPILAISVTYGAIIAICMSKLRWQPGDLRYYLPRVGDVGGIKMPIGYVVGALAIIFACIAVAFAAFTLDIDRTLQIVLMSVFWTAALIYAVRLANSYGKSNNS